MLSFAIGSLLVFAAQFGIAVVKADSIAVDASLGRRGLNMDHHHILAKRHNPNPLKRGVNRSKRCGKQLASAVSSSQSASKTSTKSNAAASQTPKSKPKPQATVNTPRPKPHGSGKIGLDWGADYSILSKFVVPGAPVYNWSPQPPMDALKYGMNPVPMLWGKKNLGNCGNRCWSDVHKGGSYDTIMGFNEPNQQGQSDISYQEAISLWKQHIEVGFAFRFVLDCVSDFLCSLLRLALEPCARSHLQSPPHLMV